MYDNSRITNEEESNCYTHNCTYFARHRCGRALFAAVTTTFSVPPCANRVELLAYMTTVYGAFTFNLTKMCGNTYGVERCPYEYVGLPTLWLPAG